MKIEKPGFYKTRDGLKVEVKFLWNGYASGIDQDTPLTWIDTGEHWCYSTGTHGRNRDLDIVEEWHEPLSITAELALIVQHNEYKIVFAKNIGLSKVLASKTVTITEGEGMTNDDQTS